MNFRRAILKLLIGVAIIMAVQNITYYTFSRSQLKRLRMDNWAGMIGHKSDSVLVRDYFANDCNVGDKRIYYSHDLAKDEDFMKLKFSVKYVKFQEERDVMLVYDEARKYNLVYDTWSFYDPESMSYGYFNYKVTRREEVRVNKNYIFQREVTYNWVLFMWVKTFELRDSYSLDS